MTVGELIRELTKYPMEAPCYAYEGEVTGVVIVVKRDPLHTEVIHANERDAFAVPKDNVERYPNLYE